MSDDSKLEWALLCVILVILVVTLSFCNPAIADTFENKPCHQVLTDSREAGEANQANWKWVAEYLSTAGITKADPRYSHGSVIVHCILFRHETIKQAAEQLVKELK